MSLVSRANDDIVVSNPQNPTATNSENQASRFPQDLDDRKYAEDAARDVDNLDVDCSVSRTIGDSASWYLTNA